MNRNVIRNFSRLTSVRRSTSCDTDQQTHDLDSDSDCGKHFLKQCCCEGKTKILKFQQKLVLRRVNQSDRDKPRKRQHHGNSILKRDGLIRSDPKHYVAQLAKPAQKTVRINFESRRGQMKMMQAENFIHLPRNSVHNKGEMLNETGSREKRSFGERKRSLQKSKLIVKKFFKNFKNFEPSLLGNRHEDNSYWDCSTKYASKKSSECVPDADPRTSGSKDLSDKIDEMDLTPTDDQLITKEIFATNKTNYEHVQTDLSPELTSQPMKAIAEPIRLQNDQQSDNFFDASILASNDSLSGHPTSRNHQRSAQESEASKMPSSMNQLGHLVLLECHNDFEPQDEPCTSVDYETTMSSLRAICISPVKVSNQVQADNADVTLVPKVADFALPPLQQSLLFNDESTVGLEVVGSAVAEILASEAKEIENSREKPVNEKFFNDVEPGVQTDNRTSKFVPLIALRQFKKSDANHDKSIEAMIRVTNQYFDKVFVTRKLNNKQDVETFCEDPISERSRLFQLNSSGTSVTVYRLPLSDLKQHCHQSRRSSLESSLANNATSEKFLVQRFTEESDLHERSELFQTDIEVIKDSGDETKFSVKKL